MAQLEDLNRAWGDALAAWALPAALVESAPASPYFFDPQVFGAAADAALARERDSVSDAVAREALNEGGTVLDVGIGAGAASLRLDPAHLTGVDSSPELLDAFAERAARRKIAYTPVRGTWPDVARKVARVDVVVCHHVLYNVADLASFASALASKARRRVVIELSAIHPLSWLAPYFEALHGWRQPNRPTAADAAAVLDALGFPIHEESWQRSIPKTEEREADAVSRIARRLCLPPERIPELEELLVITPPAPSRDVVTIWW